LRANAVEAAEQSGILTLPEIRAPLSLERMITELEPVRLLVFCDETADVQDPIAALVQARHTRQGHAPPLAVLVGPEGGFAPDERAALLKLPNAVRLPPPPPPPPPAAPPPPPPPPPPRPRARARRAGRAPPPAP